MMQRKALIKRRRGSVTFLKKGRGWFPKKLRGVSVSGERLRQLIISQRKGWGVSKGEKDYIPNAVYCREKNKKG